MDSATFEKNLLSFELGHTVAQDFRGAEVDLTFGQLMTLRNATMWNQTNSMRNVPLASKNLANLRLSLTAAILTQNKQTAEGLTDSPMCASLDRQKNEIHPTGLGDSKTRH
jgi:hypothetical protein